MIKWFSDFQWSNFLKKFKVSDCIWIVFYLFIAISNILNHKYFLAVAFILLFISYLIKIVVPNVNSKTSNMDDNTKQLKFAFNGLLVFAGVMVLMDIISRYLIK